MRRHPDCSTLLLDPSLNGLSDPPGGIGGKPHPPVGVESSHGLHETQVTLLDQILQWQPSAEILFGYANHEPQI